MGRDCNKKSVYKLQRILIFLSFLMLISYSAFATVDTLNKSTSYTQNVNASFIQTFRQNTRPAFFGNEYGNPIKDLLVADLMVNFAVFHNERSRFYFVFNPRVKLRLLAGYKSPVKSPSYMPGGTLYGRLNADTLHPKFFTLSYSHQPNGQRGPALNPNGSFNRDSGKFTTNYYTLYYNFGNQIIRGNAIKSLNAELGLEVHAGLFNTGYSIELKDKYGFVRTNGSLQYNLLNLGKHENRDARQLASQQRLLFELSYIMDKFDNYSFTAVNKRLLVSCKYYYQFKFMENTALMAGLGYRGQDDYNIYFQDSYAYFTVGIAAGISFDWHRH